VQKEATQLRENHLRELLDITHEANDNKEHEKRLKILIRAHKKQYAYQKIQHILKPQQKSGLAHILVPNDADPESYLYDPEQVKAWQMVHNHKMLQQFLLE
jgi:predicted Zn-ribbon and HTH transcriptional regulator